MAEGLDLVTPFTADEAPSMENFNARIAQVNEALAGAGGNYLPLSGGELTGPLTVQPPVGAGHAASKEYVDAEIRNAVQSPSERFVRIIITDMTSGSGKAVNVRLSNWYSENNSIYNAGLSYTGTVPFSGNVRIRLVPPPYYAFNGLSGSALPYLVIGDQAWAGMLDANGVYMFDVGTPGAGAAFRFVRNYGTDDQRDSVAVTLEVA